MLIRVYVNLAGACIKEIEVAKLHSGKLAALRLRSGVRAYVLVASYRGAHDRNNSENGFRVEVWFHGR